MKSLRSLLKVPATLNTTEIVARTINVVMIPIAVGSNISRETKFGGAPDGFGIKGVAHGSEIFAAIIQSMLRS